MHRTPCNIYFFLNICKSICDWTISISLMTIYFLFSETPKKHSWSWMFLSSFFLSQKQTRICVMISWTWSDLLVLFLSEVIYTKKYPWSHPSFVQQTCVLCIVFLWHEMNKFIPRRKLSIVFIITIVSLSLTFGIGPILKFFEVLFECLSEFK